MKVDRTDGRLTILDLGLMVAGVSLGLWLVLDQLRGSSDLRGKCFIMAVFVLGGVSVVGAPVLLWHRARGGSLGPGELLWFFQGTAAWLLLPPIFDLRIRGKPCTGTMAMNCYLQGGPLMGSFLAISLLTGGWLRLRRGRRRTGREVFGLLVGPAWAVMGLSVLWQIVRGDLR